MNRRHGHVQERLRLFFRVWLDTDCAEDAMWAVLEADRRDRHDEKRRLREGRPHDADPVAAVIVEAACAEEGVGLAEFLDQPRGRRTAAVGRVRAIAARALRDLGYSYRAIGAFTSCSHVAVQEALARAAGSRALVEASERARAPRRAHAAARRLVAV